MSNELGNKLKSAKKKHDYSLAYVGKMINKSEAIISRHEANQIILNITGGTEGLVCGVMLCTDGLYVPNMKKVLVSKKDLTFTDELEKSLKLTQEEIDNIVENNI